MANLTSVGVQVTESDLISYVPPQSASIGAYVGHFNWGPADQLINVNSEKTLATIFGAPKNNAGSEPKFIPSYLTAASFLQYGNSLKVARAVNIDARNAAGVQQSYLSSPGSGPITFGILIKNKEDFDIQSLGIFTTENSPIYARYPGLLGNSLEVQIYHYDNTTVGAPKYVADLATEAKLNFGTLPGQTYWSQDTNGSGNDEIHIIVRDSTGFISGTIGAILESYQGLSLQPGAQTLSGGNNYFADVINAGSSYLYINAEAEEQIASLPIDGTYDLGDANFMFEYGTNGGNDSHSIGNVTATLGLNFFVDIDNTEINLLFAECFDGDANINGSNLIAQALENIVAERLDLMAFVSAPINLYTITATGKKDEVLNGRYKSSGTPSSFLVFDSTPVYVYNKYTDKYNWIPACGHMAGICAYTDAISDPWFSPAGLNRGQLRGVTKLAYNPIQIDRDELYTNNINPIVSLPGEGIILYGDKTGQMRPSSFDRINVRRLFIVIEKAIRKASRYQLFELNDEFTQRAFKNTVDPYLRDIRSRRGIIDYAVVCDSTNNTPAVVDSNRFVADIYVKPTHSINFITLNFIATRNTVSFNEISG